MNNDAINSAIQSLQAVYTVWLALSLGEAFRQLVTVSPTDENHREIHWDRIPNLLSFLLLIVPFFQGMNRYLFDIYINNPRASSYAGHLFVDCVVFTIEGSFFFVLSRLLPLTEWRRFYATVIFLLLLDVIWGCIVWLRHSPAIKPWVMVNLIAFPLIIVILLALRKSKTSWGGTILCALVVLARTAFDYYFSWNIYFPS